MINVQYDKVLGNLYQQVQINKELSSEFKSCFIMHKPALEDLTYPVPFHNVILDIRTGKLYLGRLSVALGIPFLDYYLYMRMYGYNFDYENKNFLHYFEQYLLGGCDFKTVLSETKDNKFCRGTSLVARVLDSITPKPAYSKEPPVARDIKVFLEIISGKSLNVVNLNVLSPRECLYTFFLNYLLKNPFVVVPLSFAKLMSRYREEYVISFINYIFLLKDRQLLTSLLSIGHLNTDSQVKIYLNFYDLFKNRLLSTAIKSIATDRNFLSCLASVTVSPFETFNNSLSEYLQSYIKFNETLSIVDDIKSFLDYKEYGIALGTLELEPNNIGTLGKLFTKNIEWLFSDITNTDTDKIGWYRAYYNKGITLMSDRYLTFVLGISDFAGYFNYLYVKNLRDKIAFVLEKNSNTTVHIILSRISYIVIFSYYSLLKNIYACNDLYRNSHLFNYLIQTELAKNRLEYMFSTFNILVNFIIYHQGSFIDETSIKSECLILTETVLLKLERILGI